MIKSSLTILFFFFTIFAFIRTIKFIRFVYIKTVEQENSFTFKTLTMSKRIIFINKLMMFAHVFTGRFAKNKVFNAIIGLYSIDMMNNFIFIKKSTNMLLHNISMFFNIILNSVRVAVNFYINISLSNSLSTFPCRIFISHFSSRNVFNSFLGFFSSHVSNAPFYVRFYRLFFSNLRSANFCPRFSSHFSSFFHLSYLLFIFIIHCFFMNVNTCYADSSSDLQKIRISLFDGGVNSQDFFDKIGENEGVQVENLFINNKGQAKTRTGQALYNQDVGSTAFNGLGTFYLDPSTSYVVMASGTAVYRNNSTTNWTQISTSSLGSGYDTGFIQANNLLFAFNGNANTAWWSGSSWNAGGTWPTSPPVITTAAWLNNYLFGAGNPTYTDWVFVSTNLDPTSFPTSTIIKVNSGDGQSIKRLEAYRTGELIVYKERSIWDLDINAIDTTCTPQPTCQWTLTAISRDIGTPAPRSVVSLGNDQWFLSSEPFAVRSLIRSQFDKTFVEMKSKNIQDIFDGSGTRIINKTQISKAAAVLFNNMYILAIPTGSSTVNDFVVAYSFITNSWFTITGWYPKDWVVYNNSLYYTDANDGRVVQCFIGTTGDFGTESSSTSGPTVAINSQYSSRGVDFGYPENYKALDAVSVEFYPTGDFDATIAINIDNSGWQDVGTINLSGNALTLPFTLPATLSGDGFAISTLQLQRYGEFKRIQVRVTVDDESAYMYLQAINIYGRIKPWRRE